MQPIQNNICPISLVPREALLAILDNVSSEQGSKTDRLSIVIEIDEIFAFCESHLLRDVIVVEQVVIMCITFPLATKDSFFTVFRAFAVPMPQPEPDLANKWKVEAPYLAISKNNKETAFLTEYDLGSCIGSSIYQICLQKNAYDCL